MTFVAEQVLPCSSARSRFERDGLKKGLRSEEEK
jgi:hypothetical protein